MTGSGDGNAGPGHAIRLRVRYAETDQMGYVHHATHVVWFEEARTELLRSRGLPYAQLEAEGWRLVVSRLECSYLVPVRYDQEVEIHAWLDELRGASFRVAYRAQVDGRTVCEGRTTLVCTDRAGKVTRLPERLRNALEH